MTVCFSSFRCLLVLSALLLVGSLTTMAGVAPPDGPIRFYVHNPEGVDVGRLLDGVAEGEARAGGLYWVGEATRDRFGEIVEAGFAPVFIGRGEEGDWRAGMRPMWTVTG